MTVPTFMLILDAGRSDYVNPEWTPFLARLQQKGMRGRFESPPGFAQRTTMFTGTYPDTSQNLSAFGYAPERSPFRWVRFLGPLAALYRPRKVMFPARVAVKHATRLLTGAYHTDPAWIPARYLPFFEPVEDTRPVFDPGALPFPSIFDLLRARRRPFKYLAHPVSGDDEDVFRRVLATYRAKEDQALVVAQFSATDEGGHRHGPALPPGAVPALGQTARDHETMVRNIREIDRKVEEIDAAMTKAYGPHNLLVLGDHGMAPVRRRVDVLKALKATGLRPAKDYVVFLDSTFAKFWFHTTRAETVVRDLLPRLGCGRILDEADRRALRIAFGHRRYGDLMFAADPGVLFWPDYFHVVDSTIKGMHGYVDKTEETYGALVLHGPDVPPGADAGLRSLVDVYATLCDLTGVEPAAQNEGTSVLRPERAAQPPSRPHAGNEK